MTLEILLDIGTFLGFAGALPQAYRTFKRREVLRDFSLLSQLIILCCLGTSATYAYLNEAWLAFAVWVVQFSWTSVRTVWIVRASRGEKSD